MFSEIVSTTTESGLFKGSKGFCPVALTESTPKNLIKPLVDLARRQVEEADNLRENPDDFYSFFPLVIEDQHFYLLTRGSRNAQDHGAPYIVHQMLFDKIDQHASGPAAILANDSVWVTRWSAKPQLLKPREIDSQPLSPRICRLWEKITGDAGWAGCPVEAFEKKKSCVLLASSKLTSSELIQLFVESQSLIPHEQRWQILIAIGAWHPFKVDSRFWMAFDRGTQAAVDSMHRENTLRIDLLSKLNRASGKYSEEARAGAWIRKTASKAKSLPAASELVLDNAEFKLSKAVQRPNETARAGKKKKRNLSLPQKAASSRAPGKKTAFAPKPITETQQTSSPNRLKFALVAIIVIGLGGGIWFAAATVNSIVSALNSVESGPVTPPLRRRPNQSPIISDPSKNLVDSPGAGGSTDNGDSTNRSDSSSGTATASATEDSVAATNTTPNTISDEKIRTAFKEIATVDLTANQTAEKQEFFSLPLGSAFISDYLDFTLDTISARNKLNWRGQDKAWIVESSNGAIAKIFVETDEEQNASRFFWQWTTTSSADLNPAPFQAGRLTVSLRNDPQTKWTVPLAKPERSQPFRIIDSVIESPKLQPHLSDYLCQPDVFPLFDWQVQGLLAPNTSDQSLLLPPKTGERKNRIVVPIDNTVLKQKIAELLDTDLSATNVYSGVADQMLDYHGPFGLRMDCSFELDQDNKLLMKIRSQVLIDSPGQDNSSVMLQVGRTAYSKGRAEQLDSIKSVMLDGLMEHLGKSGTEYRSIIQKGGKGCQTADEPSERVSLALGGLLYQHISELLEAPVQFRVDRYRELDPRTKTGFSVTALSY